MPYIKETYIPFYLEGRGEEMTRLRKEISVSELAEEAKTADKPLYHVVRDAAERAATPLRTGIPRQRWLEENGSAIKECGGDSSAAYDAFLKGRIDELAGSLEGAVLEEWESEFCEEDDDEDDDDEDDDDE